MFKKNSTPIPCLTNIPEIMLIKSQDSVYLDVTKDFLSLVGWESRDQAAGRKDFDLPCPASKSTNLFIKENKLALNSNKPIIIIEINNFQNGWCILLIEKKLSRYANI